MANPRKPVFRAASFGAGGGTLDWSAVGIMGALYLRNAGPDECFIAWDAIPAASVGDGRIRLKADEALNLDAVETEFVGVITAGGDTAVLEGVGMPRPGASGFGFA